MLNVYTAPNVVQVFGCGFSELNLVYGCAMGFLGSNLASGCAVDFQAPNVILLFGQAPNVTVYFVPSRHLSWAWYQI